MKKIILFIITIIISINLFAQNDTTIINKPVKFETEIITSKTGKTSEKVYAIVDGKYYDSNKSSMKRYYTIIKFGGVPNVAFISNKKKTNIKVIVI